MCCRLVSSAFAAWAERTSEVQKERDSLAKVASFLHQNGLVKAWNSWKEGAVISAARRQALSQVTKHTLSISASQAYGAKDWDV